MCPAEAMSYVEAFCYITGILQKFKILPKQGETVDLSMSCGTLNDPKEQEIRFFPRFTREEIPV